MEQMEKVGTEDGMKTEQSYSYLKKSVILNA